MWLMAGAIFLASKWFTFWRAPHQFPRATLGRIAGYLFFWPGMDANAFLGSEKIHRPVWTAKSIAWAIVKVAFGILLLFVVARLTTNPLVAGWIGMTGIVFILHFGLFDLLSVFWRSAGVDAKPIMNVPIKATSLTEFWGRRWNGAFNQLVLDIFFRRLSRAIGVMNATLIAFAVSGFIHELVISLPAGGGYGLPTAYFVLQGCGAVTQRSKLGRRIHLDRGFGGWIFTMLVTAGPVFWLFHPLFIRQVTLPFMQAIHAL
jgi:alginate O-acetyltransferase complex protein AlgI